LTTGSTLGDAASPEGQRLISGIEDEKTLYPDEYTRYLSFAHLRRKEGASSDMESQGLGYAIRAFQIRPSLLAAKMVAGWKTESEELVSKKKAICQDYVAQFEAHKTELKHQTGFVQRRAAAERMAAFLKSLEDPSSDTVQTKEMTSSGEEREINGVLALPSVHGSQPAPGFTEVGSHHIVRGWSKSQLSVDSCGR
jgi:hypothetical protein